MNLSVEILRQPYAAGNQSYFHRWFLFNNRWINSCWILLLSAGFFYQSYLALQYNSNDTSNNYLITARFSAYNLLILVVLLWLPVMRHATGWLQVSIFRHLLPLELCKLVHKCLGHGLFAFALLHGVFYLLYYDGLEGDFLPILVGEEADLVRSMRTTMYEFVSEDESIEQINLWVSKGWPLPMYEQVVEPIMREDCTKCHSNSSTQTYAIPRLKLTDYDSVKSLAKPGFESRQFRINATGIIMFFLFLVMWFTSLKFFRNKKYHVFQHVHRLGYLTAILALLHIPRFEYCFAPSLILFIEYILNHSVNYWPNVKAKLIPISSRHLELRIILPKPVSIPTSQYVQIRIKQLHKKEWHSISLINSGDSCKELGLIIKDLGDWTSKLLAFAVSNGSITVDVRGPYASALGEYQHQRQGLFFAGGVGITPVLSAMYATDPVKPMRIIWVFQDWQLFKHLAPILIAWKQRSTKYDVYCYATSERPDSLTLPAELQVHSGRANLEQHIEDWQRLDYDKNVAFVCGPQGLARQIHRCIRSLPGWRIAVEQF